MCPCKTLCGVVAHGVFFNALWVAYFKSGGICCICGGLLHLWLLLHQVASATSGFTSSRQVTPLNKYAISQAVMNIYSSVKLC